MLFLLGFIVLYRIVFYCIVLYCIASDFIVLYCLTHIHVGGAVREDEAEDLGSGGWNEVAKMTQHLEKQLLPSGEW